MFGLLALFAVAGAFTTLWLGSVFAYLSAAWGWADLMARPPGDLALAALVAIGPIIAAWLVVAYIQLSLTSFRQNQILQQVSEQSRRNVDLLESKARILLQTHESERRRRLEENTSFVVRDLIGCCATLAERVGMISEAETDVLWARAGAGDLWGFVNAFLSRNAAYKDFDALLAERAAKDPLALFSLQAFLRRYPALILHLHDIDAHPLLQSMIDDSPLSQVNALFIRVQRCLGAAKPEPGKKNASSFPSSQGAAPDSPPPLMGSSRLSSSPSPLDAPSASPLASPSENQADFLLSQESRSVSDSLSRLKSALAQLSDASTPPGVEAPKPG